MSEKSGFYLFMERMNKEHEELLKALGSDYDEEGIPYWEKWGKKETEETPPEFNVDEIW